MRPVFTLVGRRRLLGRVRWLTFPCMSTKRGAFEPKQVPPEARVAIVAARFNEHIVEKLLEGCLRRLEQMGIGATRVEVFRVPGAFELPLAAQAAVRSRRFEAVICLGAVVRGDTPHFDYVAGECARGLRQVNLAESVPVIFGVLTTNTEQQALDRAGGSHSHTGEAAAEAAAEMILVLRKIAHG
jgi:6,7-dimethyl-8-ribityllumazine synthase